VDHAGLSDLLPQLKDITSLKLDILRAFLNKSSSLAYIRAPTDVMEETQPQP